MKTQPLHKLADAGHENAAGYRVIGRNGKPGRTVYREVGKVWRERSNQFCFVSDGRSDNYRFLPDETLIQIL